MESNLVREVDSRNDPTPPSFVASPDSSLTPNPDAVAFLQ